MTGTTPSFINGLRPLATILVPALFLAITVGGVVVVNPWVTLAAAAVPLMLYATLNPRWAMVLIFGAIMLDQIGALGFQIAGIPLTLSKVFVLLALAAWSLRAWFGGLQWVRPHLVLLALCGVIGTMCVSMVYSSVPTRGITVTLGVAMLTVLVALISASVDNEDLPWIITAMGVIVATAMAGTLLFELEGYTSSRNIISSAATGERVVRNGGTMIDPNLWCVQLLLVCPFVVGGLVGNRHWTSRWLLMVVVVLFPLSVLQSMSRAGSIALFAILPLLLFQLRHHRRVILVCGLLVVALSFLAVDLHTLMDRMNALFQRGAEEDFAGARSLAQRKILLNKAIQLFYEHWGTGCGVGMFQAYSGEATFVGKFKTSHNSYANVAAEQGILGVLSHLGFVVTVIAVIVRCLRNAHSDRMKSLAVGFTASMVGFALMAVTLNLETFACFYLILGLGLVLERAARAEALSPRNSQAI